MLRVHHALIRSKIKLFKLHVWLHHEVETVCNRPSYKTGIRLATGYFCTSHLVSVHGIRITATVCVCRTLLLHLYTAKLALQPKHSKQGAIFYHTSCYRYGLTHTTVPKPVGALPARPLQRLGIKLPDQIPTNSILTYHMPYVRSLARQTHKSSDICPYVLLACRGGTLHTSGPYSYVQ